MTFSKGSFAMIDKNEKSKYSNDNENGMKINARSHIRFNIIDFFVILIVLLVIAAMVVYFWPGLMERFSSNGEMEITYVLEFRGVEEAFIANIKSGESVYDASQNFKRGTVKSVAIESYSVLEYDSSSGEAVMKEHPNLKTLIITISVSAIYTEGEGYSINGERIAVGGKYAVRFANFTGTAYCTQVRLSSK